jgi:hypothetical protein
MKQSEKVMPKKEIEKLIRELVSDGRHNDDEAFDIADGILFDEEGLKAGIKKHYSVRDPQGWLANKIS